MLPSIMNCQLFKFRLLLCSTLSRFPMERTLEWKGMEGELAASLLE